MKIKNIFFLLGLMIVLTGCASKQTQQKLVGQINFSYKVQKQEPRKPWKIAVVSPQFQAFESNRSNNVQSANPFMAMMAAQGRSDYLVNLNELFDSNYKNRLTTSMVATFNEVLSSRGFSIMGPYRTFDDITYSDKKSAYLALVPTLFIYIDQKSKIRECTSRYCEDVGEFQISGELVLKLVEPMTQQAFMSKRINLSDLTTPRQYIKRSAKKHNSEGLIGSVISSVVNQDNKPMIDDTDKVLVEALNEFFAKSMAKVDSYLSSDELLSYEKDVMAVKELKRF